jgi:hypothetical protein
MPNLLSPDLKTLILPLLIPVLFFSCKKDDPGTGNKHFRITSRDVYSHDTLKTASTFHYSDNKISLMRSKTFSDRNDSLKTEVEYDGDHTITQISYFRFGGVWYKYYKYIMELSGGNVASIEDHYLDGTHWHELSRTEYQYQGSLLINEIWYSHKYQHWSPEIKIDYECDGNIPVTAVYYEFDDDVWSVVYQEVASYSNGRIDSVSGSVFSDSSLYENTLYKYQYSGEQISYVEIYYYAPFRYAGSVSFTYDSYGNLVRETEKMFDEESSFEYGYEEGTGNYRQFIEPGGGLSGMNSYPYPTKRILAKPADIPIVNKNRAPDILPKALEHY